ncbi:unnamed protein product [Arctogadus glacialis]
MILPLKTTVLNSVKPNEEDRQTVREVKAAIRENLIGRYSTSCHDFLNKATALDPRFKTLPHVDDACCDTIYNSLTTEIETMEEQKEEATGTTAASSSSAREHPEPEGEAAPPVKKSAMAELFGDLFKLQDKDVRKRPAVQQLAVLVYSH